jgi:hypothetical protein
MMASIKLEVRVLLLAYLSLSAMRVILPGSDVFQGHGRNRASDMRLWNDIFQPSDVFPLVETKL